MVTSVNMLGRRDTGSSSRQCDVTTRSHRLQLSRSAAAELSPAPDDGGRTVSRSRVPAVPLRQIPTPRHRHRQLDRFTSRNLRADSCRSPRPGPQFGSHGPATVSRGSRSPRPTDHAAPAPPPADTTARARGLTISAR